MEKVQFTNKELKKLILPLFLEQLLMMLVGIADTFTISYVGEAAVSGVSLVNSFNTIFIYLFTALASGGAIMISQYIGKKSYEMAGETSSQLFMFSAIFSIVLSVGVLIGNQTMLRIMFGKVEEPVMESCIIYLRISAYSYPALAIYNAGASVFRSMGKTSITMYISMIANIINVVGNIVGVFILQAGVAGVAYPSLIARIFTAVAITLLCFQRKNIIFYKLKWIVNWNKSLLKQILNVAIPNGIENGIFQFVKVALSSVVALFGTYQIAANGVAQSIWSLAALMGVTMGPVYITVIGQCMGAGMPESAAYYFRKLTKLTIVLSIGWNALIFALTPILMSVFALSDASKKLVIWLVLIHNICNAIAFPLSGPLGNGLRAAGDIKFTMNISILSTIFCRLFFSILFGIDLKLGVIGIALAMCLDWIIRGIIFTRRFYRGKWKSYQMIK